MQVRNQLRSDLAKGCFRLQTLPNLVSRAALRLTRKEQRSAKTANLLMVAGLCGFAGPIIFAGLVIVLGALQPGYDHISQTVSVLGAEGAPHKALMDIFGFPFLGMVAIVFAAGIRNLVTSKGIYQMSSVLLVVSGLALAMIGIFYADPGDVDVSWRGMTHAAFTVISSVSFAVAPIFIGAAFWRETRWRAYAMYSYATAIVTLLLSLVSTLDIADIGVGLFQRVSMAIPMLWMMVTSLILISEATDHRLQQTRQEGLS